MHLVLGSLELAHRLQLGQSVAVQPDGKIVVAGISDRGSRSYDFAVARYEGILRGVVFQPDPNDPASTQLVVAGTSGDDKIQVHRVGNSGAVEVKRSPADSSS